MNNSCSSAADTEGKFCWELGGEGVRLAFGNIEGHVAASPCAQEFATRGAGLDPSVIDLVDKRHGDAGGYLTLQ